MFIPIALADGSVVFVNLRHVVNVVRSSADQCVINPVVGESIIVNGKAAVEAVMKALKEASGVDEPPTPEPQP